MDSSHTHTLSQILTTGVCQHSSRTLAKTKRIGRRSLSENPPNSDLPKMPPRGPYSTGSTFPPPPSEHPRVSLKCFCNAACCTRLVNMAHFYPFVSLSFFRMLGLPGRCKRECCEWLCISYQRCWGSPASTDAATNKRNSQRIFDLCQSGSGTTIIWKCEVMKSCIEITTYRLKLIFIKRTRN